MTTALVPFSEIQRLAKSAVASKMFGVKTEDEAISLMMIAQSEGIHPMTAVRDYHVIQNRPSLKAETMLARFQQAGGSVQWHELTDIKADATFTHPSGGSLRLDWTIERAKAAGLGTKDNWKSFPRAMLRSRLVSEGVRTVCPGVLIGAYTPEEIIDIPEEIKTVSPEQAVHSFSTPALEQETVDGIMRQLSESVDIDSLKRVYAPAYRVAREAKDEKRMSIIQVAYEARRDELLGVQPE